jgi:hypothetical protein
MGDLHAFRELIPAGFCDDERSRTRVRDFCNGLERGVSDMYNRVAMAPFGLSRTH